MLVTLSVGLQSTLLTSVSHTAPFLRYSVIKYLSLDYENVYSVTGAVLGSENKMIKNVFPALKQTNVVGKPLLKTHRWDKGHVDTQQGS